jgi:uncharacterized protein YacL
VALLGRAVVRGVDTAAERLQGIPSAQLVAIGIGASAGALVSIALMLPVLLLPYQGFTVPFTLVLALVLAYAGGRLGATRGADLARFIGLRGRIDVRSPSRGRGVKLVDSSALIDGRIVEVARAGFLDGTLVVPEFVLEEVQGLADAGNPTAAGSASGGSRPCGCCRTRASSPSRSTTIRCPKPRGRQQARHAVP